MEGSSLKIISRVKSDEEDDSEIGHIISDAREARKRMNVAHERLRYAIHVDDLNVCMEEAPSFLLHPILHLHDVSSSFLNYYISNRFP